MSLKGYQRKFKPLELLNEEQVVWIHKATLDVLETTGVRIEHVRALEVYKKNGCNVDFDQRRVRIPPGLAEDCLRMAPSSFRVKARNPENDLVMGGDTVYFQPYVGKDTIDLDTWEPRRPTRKENYDAARVADSLVNGHFMTCYMPWFGWEGCPEVMAILESDAARIRCSDKTYETASSYDSEKFAVQFAQAVGSDIWGYMGGSPPLTWHENAIEACFTLLEADQPLQIISGNTMGASGPVTLAGATVTNNAELLSGLVLAQLVKPGARIMVMDFCFPQNMRSGSLIFSGIETYLHNAIFNQMWRYYGIPTKTPPPGPTDSKRIDYQTGYEKAIGALLCALTGANMIPLMGGLYGELVWHPIQAILDDDIASMVGRVIEGVDVNHDTIALDLINQVGPIPGHYLDKSHTRENWKKEFLMPFCADRLTYPEWMANGKKSCIDYAGERMDHILATHKINPLTASQESAVEKVLMDARNHYRKSGLISEDEWRAYQPQLNSKNYPFG